MKIAFDLDGVIFDFLSSFLPFLSKRIDENIYLNRIRQYNFWDDRVCTKKQYREALTEFFYEGGFLNLSLIPGARYHLTKLFYEDKHEIIFITNRQKDVFDDTILALERKLGIDPGLYQCVNFCQMSKPTKEKWEICKDHNIDIFIDDDFRQLQLAKKNFPDIKTIWFNFEDRLWTIGQDKKYVPITNDEIKEANFPKEVDFCPNSWALLYFYIQTIDKMRGKK